MLHNPQVRPRLRPGRNDGSALESRDVGNASGKHGHAQLSYKDSDEAGHGGGGLAGGV